MSEFHHGIRMQKVGSTETVVAISDSGIVFAVGTAPVHINGGAVNEIVQINGFGHARDTVGYSDEWSKYTLCEVADALYNVYNAGSSVFVNVLDPTVHKVSVAETEVPLVGGAVTLPLEAIAKTVKVKTEATGAPLVLGTDYGLVYTESALVVEPIDGGAVLPSAASLFVEYDAVDPSLVTAADIIGGFDVTTKKFKGLALIDSVFAKCLFFPDIIIAPGYSHISEVAAVMCAKAEKVSGLVEAKALIDADTKNTGYYADVPAWKTENGISSNTGVLLWPCVKRSGKIYRYSTHAAGLIATVDAANDGCPSDSPSNHRLMADSAVLADGTEVLLNINEANQLNAQGIVTALRSSNGFVLWGNTVSSFPDETDPRTYFINSSRTRDWIGKRLILRTWSMTDRNLTRRLVDSVVDGQNIELNSLVAEGKLLGARVEFSPEDNPEENIKQGMVVFRIYTAEATPTQDIVYKLIFDASYITSIMA